MNLEQDSRKDERSRELNHSNYNYKINTCLGLCDLRENINIMSLSLFTKMILGNPRPTTDVLLLANQSLARQDGIIEGFWFTWGHSYLQ